MFEDDNPIQKAECDLLKRSEYAKKIAHSILCILRSVTDVDAFQSGRFAKQNGRPETHKISSLTLLV